jgi:hypothetical protein
MPSKREYLISKGLAQPGRGRFSREATAELERARQAGVVFSDERAGSAQADPESSVPLPAGWTPPAPVKNYPVLRDLKSMIGYTAEGARVESGICFKCGMHVSRCPCRSGITSSKITARWDPECEKYGKPIDSLAPA